MTRSVRVLNRHARAELDSPARATLRAVVPGVYTAYVWKNVSILVWFGPMTLDKIPQFEEGCRLMTEQYPEGLSSVNIMVPGGRSMPSAEVRAELARVISQYSPYSAAAAVVLRGQGFWASALRGMLLALKLLLPRRLHVHMFGGLDELAAWLPALHSEKTGVAIDAGELLSVLQQVEQASVEAAAA